MTRKYLPTFTELIDRLSIVQIKEVLIPAHKKEYSAEIKDIIHDINEILNNETQEKTLTAEAIRAIIVIAQMNLHIWHNESDYRNGKEGSRLELTHGLNGLRNTAKNKLTSEFSVEDRMDFKIDCLASEFKDWEISW
jgi:hypothetical protein